MKNVFETAVRGWIEPRRIFRGRSGSRHANLDTYALVFDTETTTDYAQALLYGFFQVRHHGDCEREGIFCADDLDANSLAIIQKFAAKYDLELLSRTEFITEFYAEVYGRGALCVGFNLPFDLSRIALGVAAGRGIHRRSFRLKLSLDRWSPDIRVETISSKASFIRFAPCKRRQRNFFRGRFLDLRAAVAAFTGESHTLASACTAFGTAEGKAARPELGRVTSQALEYARQDVRATWALYERVREEYTHHPFATFANEKRQPEGAVPLTRLVSAASLAKAYLRQFNIWPLLVQWRNVPHRELGRAMAAYYGGRAEVRVRGVEVPISLVDFISMYPTVFILQDLQRLLTAAKVRTARCLRMSQWFLDEITLPDLYNPDVWPRLNRFVLVIPDGDILPIRFRLSNEDTYQIAVTPICGRHPMWYTLADCVASKILTGKTPKILNAFEVQSTAQQAHLHPVCFRGDTLIDPRTPIFKTVVEERQRSKQRSLVDPESRRLESALKIFLNSASYGIYAEINVRPPGVSGRRGGIVFSADVFASDDAGNEQPGTYCNPFLASLAPAGARLLLAMLEVEVASHGGTFAFCDTDSLAIVAGDACPKNIPCLPKATIFEIIKKFDQLNPYDARVVPHLLKLELGDVRCLATSAKRYVVFERNGEALEIL